MKHSADTFPEALVKSELSFTSTRAGFSTSRSHSLARGLYRIGNAN
jgi:hypothetical protein